MMVADLSHDARLDRALAMHAAANWPEAESLYRSILNALPNDPDTLNLLGLLLQDRGDYHASVKMLEQALDADPNFPEALTNLARVRLALNEPNLAEIHARRAIELDNELPEAYLHLGRALIEQRNFDSAAGFLRNCLALDPGIVDASVALGICLVRQGNPRQAVDTLIEAKRRQPLTSDSLVRIGFAFLAVDHLDQAVDYHQQAVIAAPGSASAWAALAVTLRRRLDPVASTDACREALAIEPQKADMWLLLGANLASLGDFDQAAACQQKALALNPRSAAACRDLALIDHQSDVAASAGTLHAILHDTLAPEEERIAAGFALGALLDRGNNNDGAFAAYAAANRLVSAQYAREGRGFRLEDLRRTVDWLIRTFDRTFFATLDHGGDRSEQLVFIVGMSRSGTSLVEQIAASHPAVFGGGERKDIGALIRGLDGGVSASAPDQWDHGAVCTATRAHLSKVTKLSAGAVRFIDKLPDNILLLGHIAKLFPDARIIYCRRDLRDTCLSLFFQQFGDGCPWAFDLEESAGRALEIERLADHWRRVLPLRIIEVEYEQLVNDLEGQAKRLISFLDLPWDPACLDFHKTNRTIMTSSYWQVRQPLYASSVGKWRRYKAHLQPLLLHLADSCNDIPSPEWQAVVASTSNASDIAANHLRNGRLSAAEAVYGAIHQANPSLGSASHGLGLCELAKGDIAAAIVNLRHASSADPDNAGWRSDLATALIASGSFTEAFVEAKAATDINPGVAEAWVSMANAAAQLTDWQSASSALEAAAALVPKSVAVTVGQATVALERGLVADSGRLWQEVLDQEPQNLDALVGMAAVLAEQVMYDEAYATAETVVKAATRRPDLLFKLARVFFRIQMPDRAVEQARLGLSYFPQSPDLRLMLANMLGLTGDFEGAIQEYRHVLSLVPSSGAALSGLIKFGAQLDAPAIIATASERAADRTAPVHDRANAAFALANTYDNIGDYDSAFAAYNLGNQLNRSARSEPNARRILDLLDHILRWSSEVYTDETFLTASPLGNMSNVPVFVAGMPRSGTTLVEQILASHPSIVGVGERADIPHILGMGQRDRPLQHPLAWNTRDIHEKSTSVLRRLQMRDPGAQRIVNKLPDNIQWLGQIAVLYPRAHVIICRRDLRDTCWSCFTQNFFEDDMLWTDTLEECAERARLIDRLTELWLNVLPMSILEVQYEELVSDLETESRRLIDFVGLPWDSACLSFNQTKRAVMSASAWQVRQPLYSSSIGRWERYRDHLGPLLKGLEDL